MTTIYLLFIIFLIFLLIAKILSVIGVARYEKSMKEKQNNIKISVLIPARNEEDFITKTLKSIGNQTDDNFELILIVDRCNDRTLKIAEKFVETARFPSKIILNSIDPPDGENPKVFLLKKGIEAAKGGIFLFTDADCIVPEDWVQQYRRMFFQEDTGLVFGTLRVDSGSSLLTNFQNFDHIYRSFYASACAGAGFATGGFGNNLAVSRDCYESFGGYDGLPFSVTEDGVMVSAAGKSKYFNVRSIVSLNSSVITQAKKSLHEYIQQSVRWTEGAVYGPDFKSKFYYIFMLTALTSVNFAIPLSFIIPFLWVVPITGYGYLFLSSIAAGYFMKAGKKYWVYLLPSIFLFFILYQLSFLISAFRPKITWKGSLVKAGIRT